MTDPGAELLARVDVVARCRSCGTCRSVCPVFAEVGLESAVARGKVALIRSVLDGDLELSEVFEDRIQLCLNCKACVESCPSEVRVDDLILSARSGLVESGRLPLLRRLVFRLLLKRGRLLPPFGRFASFGQRWILRGLPDHSPIRLLLPLVGVDEHRVFPEFAPASFLSGAPEMVPASGDRATSDAATVPETVPASGGQEAATTSEGPGSALADRRRAAREARRVAFFVGCATNLLYPETGRATVEALSSSGVEVVIPRAQGCCGTPVFNSGDFRTARSMAKRNIDVLRAANADAVVTGCASCGLTLKREYEELLGLDGGVGLPVFDLAEFVAYRELPAEAGAGDSVSPASHEQRVRVTYHDPCHLVRGQGLSEEPRALLRSLPWVEFVEMRDADRCCGSGGTFSLAHYDISKKIGARKVAAIRDADVDVVATECPSCVMQLRDMLGQAGLDVAVVSVADLLAQRGTSRV